MVRRIFPIAFLLILSFPLFAQQIDMSRLEGMKIRSIGPAGMSGRVTSIDAVHTNPNIIYAATASGGLWKSESGGIRWAPIFDKQPVQSVGAVAINQQNPDIIWAGTGEGNPRNSQNSGLGIFKSLDGGKSWEHKGLKNTKTIHRILIDPNDPDVVYVAAMGSAWGPNPERGVFKTEDGGESWKKILYVNDESGCADLVIDPSNPNKLIAAMWEYGRKPWTFKSGGKGSGIFITVDGGKNWNKLSEKNGLPEGELGRIGLAIAPSMPKVVYALVESEKNALYRSNDGGYNWKKTADKNIGNRPFYYADIFVDPKNENRIYNLHSVVSRSEDGGKSFETLIYYSQVHPDHHAFWIHPDNPDMLIDGNDGGLAISYDRGLSWRFIENLPLAQFYHINIDNDVPYNVYGGMQDNGSWIGPSEVWQSGSIRNHHWQELYFGDGFDVVPDPADNRYGYAMYQGGNLARYDRLTGRGQFIQPIHPEGIPLRFNWNAGIAQDPFADCTVYYGSQFVHKSTDCGQSWSIISPDLTTNDTSKQKQHLSGGLTIDDTEAENNTTILCISPSPLNKDVIWVGTDDGNLLITTDGGDSWTNLIDRIKEAPKGAWIPQIEVSSYDAAEAFVVINDYRQNDWSPYVFHTKDYGKKWTRIVSDGDVSGHARSIVQDPVERQLLFLGTDHGLYVTFDGGANWNKWQDFPSVSVSDLKIQKREHDLVIGTFGRAAFILDDIRPLRELAAKGIQLLDKDFHVFSCTHAILASNKPVTGSHFPANADFRGTNPRRGAVISYWHKTGAGKEKPKEEKKGRGEKKEQKKKNGKSNSKVKIHITDAIGDTIRTFTHKPDTGFNRVSWDLRKRGVNFPSFQERKPDADEPRGAIVLPGKYEAHLRSGKDSAVVSFEVISDPREKTSLSDLQVKADALDELANIGDAANLLFERLKKAQKTLKSLPSRMEHASDSSKKDLKEAGKALSDSIKIYMEVFRGPQDFKGIDGTVRLNNKLFRTRSYLNSHYGKPSSTAMESLRQLRTEVEAVLRRTNRFFDNEWTDFRKKVEGIEMPVFENWEGIRIER